jgi:hypothetical protein
VNQRSITRLKGVPRRENDGTYGHHASGGIRCSRSLLAQVVMGLDRLNHSASLLGEIGKRVASMIVKKAANVTETW